MFNQQIEAQDQTNKGRLANSRFRRGGAAARGVELESFVYLQQFKTMLTNRSKLQKGECCRRTTPATLWSLDREPTIRMIKFP